jgi:histidyl-tRNA synthetase
LDILRGQFALHGFLEIETRAVEPLEQLLRKGETSKEVYVLRRLQELQASVPVPTGNTAESVPQPTLGEGLDPKMLGLHFDLTVPLARYVLEHSNRLEFPFKRYQIQKVWRGERPQDGRFREFTQADLDVIGQGELPFHYEVELPLVMAEALAALRVGSFKVLVNNRKLAQGFYQGLGISDVDVVLRGIDKLDKIGPSAVAAVLQGEGLTQQQAAACLELAQISGDDAAQVVPAVRRLAAAHGAEGDLLDQGLEELAGLLEAAAVRLPGTVVADLKIARGLDYYTGSVYETLWVGQESLGSVCSGGRYDSLAADRGRTYPGVGLSIGVSRLVSRILALDLLVPSRVSPAVVVVAVGQEADRAASDQVAATLRSRGIAAEVAPTAAKFGKQIRYADRRGIPYVWFPGPVDQVKDIRSGEQAEAEATTWRPPAADLVVGFTDSQGA